MSNVEQNEMIYSTTKENNGGESVCMCVLWRGVPYQCPSEPVNANQSRLLNGTDKGERWNKEALENSEINERDYMTGWKEKTQKYRKRLKEKLLGGLCSFSITPHQMAFQHMHVYVCVCDCSNQGQSIQNKFLFHNSVGKSKILDKKLRGKQKEQQQETRDYNKTRERL